MEESQGQDDKTTAFPRFPETRTTLVMSATHASRDVAPLLLCYYFKPIFFCLQINLI